MFHLSPILCLLYTCLPMPRIYIYISLSIHPFIPHSLVPARKRKKNINRSVNILNTRC